MRQLKIVPYEMKMYLFLHQKICADDGENPDILPRF